MYRILSIIAFLVFALICTAQKPAFKITGHLYGKESGYVYLNYLPGDGYGVMDSAEIKSGVFQFSGKIVTPSIAYLTTRSFLEEQDSTSFLDFYLESSQISVEGNANELWKAKIIGSRTENDWQLLQKSRKPVFDSLQNLIFEQQQYDKKVKSEHLDSLQSRKKADQETNRQIRIKKLTKKLHQIDISFIKDHPNSFVSVNLLGDASIETMRFNLYSTLYSNLSPTLKKSGKGQYINQKIQLERLLKIGLPIKDFATLDQDSNSVSLGKYKGKKMILLDFGASWCGPCRAIVPSLKEIYLNQRNSLEIIGISIQDTEEAWRKYINEAKMEWPQVRDTKGTFKSHKNWTISEYYMIDKIPALLLIDKTGKLVGKYGNIFYSAPSSYLEQLKRDIFRSLDK